MLGFRLRCRMLNAPHNGLAPGMALGGVRGGRLTLKMAHGAAPRPRNPHYQSTQVHQPQLKLLYRIRIGAIIFLWKRSLIVIAEVKSSGESTSRFQLCGKDPSNSGILKTPETEELKKPGTLFAQRQRLPKWSNHTCKPYALALH